jgi:hypothetical protein
MNNSAAKKHSILPLMIFCVLLAAMPNCGGGTADLTRDSARRLIEESDQFKAPIAAMLRDQKDLPMLPDSADESEQQALSRVLDMEMSSDPTLATLRQLGYADARITLVKRASVSGRGPLADIRPWVFDIEAVLTDKGRELAKSQGMAGDKAVPLARREMVEVTGVRKEGIRGEADFTWRAVPTEAGKAFDPSSDTFKSLPAGLREALTKSRGVGPFAADATAGWSGVNKASAAFQKYDDGWRLTGIRF